MQHAAALVGAFLLSWLLFFVVKWLTPTWDNTKRSRVPSMLHSCAVVALAFHAAPRYFPDLLGARVSPLWSTGTRFEQTWQMASVGYFVFDLHLMLAHADVFEWTYVAHHVTVIASVVFGVLHGGAAMNCLFMLHELSVPFTNIHFLLPRDSPWKPLNGAAVSESRRGEEGGASQPCR